jgi:hydrogenase nickel incorporation protein HypB
MASPGAGKTSFITATYEAVKECSSFAVIEGDIASQIDADKFAQMGVPVAQINTGGGCHLDANMIKSAINQFDLPDDSVLFVENVGNLVCPAGYRLGEHLRIVMSSTTEGYDKPYKYPAIFTDADAIILNKMDLAEAVEFDRQIFEKGIRALNQTVPIFALSCKTGEGIKEWTNWLMERKREIYPDA